MRRRRKTPLAVPSSAASVERSWVAPSAEAAEPPSARSSVPARALRSPLKANAAAPAPDFVVFNGVANQYKDHPIQVTTKGRVRVFVLDAGPSIDSSFHVVGTIFDTVVKEGVILAKGNAAGWGSQAVDLAPAQGAIIEFSPREDGMYPFVTHAFNFVGRGAIGLLMAGDGDPKN